MVLFTTESLYSNGSESLNSGSAMFVVGTCVG